MPLLRGQTLAERMAHVAPTLPAAEKVAPTLRGVAAVAEGGGPALAPPDACSALPLGELLRIGRELARGLAAAHARGLVHRDIKPSNIWLEQETGRVKILDFGLARACEGAEQLTHTGSLLGTPAYMSPEQAGGHEADARSDLFSLGCVLYHAATGRRPFIGRDALSTLVAVRTTEPPAPCEINSSLPDDLNDLIVALLSKSPADRPQTARDVADRLAAVGNGLRPTEPAAQAALLPLPPSPPGEGRGEGGRQQTAANHASSHPKADGTRVPPRWRFVLVCAAGATAVLLAGVLIVIKNREGKVVATVPNRVPRRRDSRP